MYTELLTDLINHALNNQIKVKMIESDASMPCIAFIEARLIIININWHRPQQIPFALAHEIAHFTNHDDIYLYNSAACMFRLTAERNADVAALNILMPRYFAIVDDYAMDNVDPIMHQLGIPDNLRDAAYQHLQKHLWYVHI